MQLDDIEYKPIFGGELYRRLQEMARTEIERGKNSDDYLKALDDVARKELGVPLVFPLVLDEKITPDVIVFNGVIL